MASNGDSLGTKSAIQVPRNAASDPVSKNGDIPGSDMTQLLTAWEKEVQDYEQQSGDKISDAIKLGVVRYHLPDASLREHLLLNSRVYDTYALMAHEVRAVAMARTIWPGPTPMDLRHAREECCLSPVREEGSLREGLLASERKGTKPRMVTPSKKVLAITVARSVTLHANVRRKKSKQCKFQWWRWCTLLDGHR